MAKFPTIIQVEHFIEWLKKEPQSLVWLPLLHRIATSEFAKHSAKCNSCKMFPIVGLRYRCLRCFNFDICQNCFFSQRTAKGHKLGHPMQEYCLPTIYVDDMRDFTIMVKNKFSRGRGHRFNTAYLPVDQILEGQPVEQVNDIPRNSETESIHQRVSLLAARLERDKLDETRIIENNFAATAAEDPQRFASLLHSPTPKSVGLETEGSREKQRKSSLNNPPVPNLRSPLQLIKHVDGLHKEELNNLLQKLQQENAELKHAVIERRNALQSNYFKGSSSKSTPNLLQSSNNLNFHSSSNNQLLRRRYDESSASFHEHLDNIYYHQNDNVNLSLPKGVGANSHTNLQHLLKMHQLRLEQRSKILEEQNIQLKMQLDRLNKLVGARPGKEHRISRGTSDDEGQAGELPASDLDTDLENYQIVITATDPGPGQIGTEIRRSRMENLMMTAEELNRAIESLVVVMGSPESPTYDDADEIKENNPHSHTLS